MCARMGDSTTFTSELFVEDGLLFLVTIVPFVYFFGPNPILLANICHVASIPCAGIAHCASLGNAQAFVLSLVTGIMVFVDVCTVLFCTCQLVQTDMCCEALSSMGIGCLERYEDIPLAVALLPVSVYNLLRGFARMLKIWFAGTTSGRRGVGSAILVAAFGCYAALLVREDSSNFASDILLLLVCYMLLTVTISAIDLRDVSQTGMMTVFLLSHITVSLQMYLALSDVAPDLFVGFAMAALLLSSLFSLPLAPFLDRWTPLYSLSTSVYATYFTIQSWSSLDALFGTLLVSYFTTYLGRGFLFQSDSHLEAAVYGVIFFALDVCASLYIGFLWINNRKSLFFCISAIVPMILSAVVSMYVLIARFMHDKQTRDEAKVKFPPDLDKLDASEIEMENVTNQTKAYNEAVAARHSGIIVGAHINDAFTWDESRVNKIDDLINLMSTHDSENYASTTSLQSTRNRIYFLRGVHKTLDHHDIHRETIDVMMRTLLWNLGVPTKAYAEIGATGGSWGLDVKWISVPPGTGATAYEIKRLASIRLMAITVLRNSTKPTQINIGIADDEYVDQLKRRYIFVASKASFSRATRQSKYQIYWDIVWT